ncbi:lipopolysaccharide biosynthesis protein [Clostridiaceae bacterium]|nr:lipopolysaccharide biosynthesis protein [Clostridiaceae bacterium]RKI13625.1 lipopolysaccharide biosynthesis protein [bacterium 1XD21-70]
MGDNAILRGTFWKFLERIGVFGTQFIVQIILARLLEPSDYGSLAIMIVFITVSNVLVQSGFNTALIQRRDIKDRDYSSILWVSLIVASVIYVVIFICSPYITQMYKSPGLLWPLRIIALVLFSGAFNSVQLAKVTREMDFRKIFYGNLAGTIIAGVISIVIAYLGGGLWALVFQTLFNSISSCIVMAAIVKLALECTIEWERIKKFFSYGWKLVVSGILNTLSEQLNSLVIGIKYNTSALGFYTRGMQFPHYGISIIEGTMSSVILPAIAKVQDDKEKAKNIMRNAMLLASYLVFPLMAGLAAISKNLVQILLTDKWIGCVPYMQIFCLVFALYPVHVCNLQALNAMGRSDLFLKLEIIKKCYSIAVLILAIILFDTPISVAICTLSLSPVGWLVNSFPNSKILGYGFRDQVKDLVPIFGSSILMFIIVYFLNYLNVGKIVIIVQIIVGVLFYIGISLVMKIKQFYQVYTMIQKILS